MNCLNRKNLFFIFLFSLVFVCFSNETFTEQQIKNFVNIFYVNNDFKIIDKNYFFSDSVIGYSRGYFSFDILLKIENKKIKFALNLSKQLKVINKFVYGSEKGEPFSDKKIISKLKKLRIILNEKFDYNLKLKSIHLDEENYFYDFTFLRYIGSFQVGETLFVKMDDFGNLSYVSAWISDKPVEDIKIKLNKNEAETIARNFLEERLKIKTESIRVADKSEYKDVRYIREWVRLVDHNKPVLVHPNSAFLYLDKIYNHPDYIYGGAYEEKIELRPAYVFVFNHERMLSPLKEYCEYTLIYVDAETGEIIGGF